jgi:hypothetical protein
MKCNMILLVSDMWYNVCLVRGPRLAHVHAATRVIVTFLVLRGVINSVDAVEMRKRFEIYVDGLFSIPVNLPFTKYGKAMKARNDLLKEIAGLSTPTSICLPACLAILTQSWL